MAPLTRAGSLPLNGESMRTVPVNQSAGPLLEGCEPLLLISISVPLFDVNKVLVAKGDNVAWQRSADFQSTVGAVSQTCSLHASQAASGLCFRVLADCKSAIQQIENLRYPKDASRGLH